jgi:2-amino-4-hydroxy-6-hydroxymethyldihydropteridine diphosphokinase
MTLCAISLGGNVGEVARAFDDALKRLETLPGISRLQRSRLFQTTPMGASAGEPFLNAAAVFETEWAPLEVLDRLQEIENQSGRVRTIRWGPRTLDLDLLLYGELIAVTPRLIIPHPGLWHRRFVLDPLVELIPDAVHPVLGETVRVLQHRLMQRPLPLCFVDDAIDSLEWVEAAMATEMPWPSAAESVEWLAPDRIDSAAIVFARSDTPIEHPRVIRLPDDAEQSIRFLFEILTAALDEPAPVR